MQSDFVLTRGLEGVNGEFSLLFLAYDLKRVINIVGVKALLEAIAQRPCPLGPRIWALPTAVRAFLRPSRAYQGQLTAA